MVWRTITSPASDPGASLVVADLLRRSQELRSVFQPIIGLPDHRIIGYEALLRLPPDTPFAGATQAFAAAVATEALVDLEVAALETHLRSARRLDTGRLFLNLSARAFADERMRHRGLEQLVRAAGLEPSRVVLELTELVHIDDVGGLADAIHPLREAGFLLAIDDFGAGFTNLRVLVELGPDFLKIDRSLVAGVSQHPRRRVFLESMGVLGRRINCSVVAEGVETAEDLAAVRACGIECAQGYVIAPPQPLDEVLSFRLGVAPRLEGLPAEHVGSFGLPQEGVDSRTPVGHLVHLFDGHRDLTAIPVIENARVVGLVTRNLLFQHLGHRYGFALWNDRRVIDFVEALSQGFDRLPAVASADQAVEMVRRRPMERRFDPLVLENERGAYHGLLLVDLLLAEVSRLKVEYALQSNPLTGLPGSHAFARQVEGQLATLRPFALGWVDVDNFKPFNDRYGFSRGDDVLLLLARILEAHFAREGGRFLAHTGGDDFAFLCEPEDAASVARAAAEDFAARVPALYDPPDREAGGIMSVDRRGTPHRFGFLSISIGLVVWRGEANVDYRRLVETAAEVKAAAKQAGGGTVVSNQRSLDTRAGSATHD
jgi:EAL domain-containing protein (putative c-di-GMP-specific phosphodiesterase class I)/GGDEF domain-containing protein